MTALVFRELPHPGLIRFSGVEAQAFLHNQLSCDIAALTFGHSTYGAYCTPKGRVLASFLLWRSEQGLFMQLPSSLREPIQQQLSKFILRSKVKVEDASSDRALIGVAGKDAAALLRQVLEAIPKLPHDVVHVDGVTVLRLPVDRYQIVVSREHAPRLAEALGAADKAGPEHWEWLAIRAGIPVILPATQEQFVPQMVNLDLIGGVSFQKGCYPGQEIVARMHYRGTLKQRMYLANVAAAERPQPGDKLYSPGFGDQASGAIVNAARAPDSGHDVLAVVQIASAERGDIHWKSLDGPVLKLLPLPYLVTSDRQ
jgi:folate-binding protein YgfZ